MTAAAAAKAAGDERRLHEARSADGRMGAVACAALAVAVLATAWSGRVTEGQSALAASDAALARGDVVEAILSARAAARARCPSCAAPAEGLAKLEALAQAAEARGDRPTAVSAWRAVRAAALETATWSTRSAQRERAESAIARLGRQIDAAAVAAGASPSAGAHEEKLRAALATDDMPGGLTAVLLAAGGALFLVGAVRTARASKRTSGPSRLPLTDAALALAGAGLATAGPLLF